MEKICYGEETMLVSKDGEDSILQDYDTFTNEMTKEGL